MIRVTVFDDNDQQRDGLKLLVNAMDDMSCAGTYPDCSNVLENIAESNPDVVLMDIDMPKVGGIEGVQIIRTKHPTLKILMRTVFEDDNKVFASICAGANGYMLKQAKPTKLIEAIQEVVAGGAPMTPIIARKVLELFAKQSKPKESKDYGLSERELDILQFLVKGFTYKLIAEKCFISYSTVNTHVSKIYQKLQVQSSAGAVSLAIREGLVK